MKIALLNLPVDNNFGGNLQRYALVKVLQDMGHEVVHINLRYDYSKSFVGKLWTMFRRFAGNCYHLRCRPLLPEWEYKNKLRYVDKFYNRYIPHTEIYGKDFKEKFKLLPQFDFYIVGSDQVWRKRMTGVNGYGISTYFLDFLSDDQKRIAYGVSLGTNEDELLDDEITKLKGLYEKFCAVSVREKTALNIFDKYHWINPHAVSVLDPTMLLSASDYCHLIDNAKTTQCNGDMFCYILDMEDEKKSKIDQLKTEMNLTPFVYSIDDKQKNLVSIEQWLRAFRDCKFVVTDSYHGLIFSIIFRKPFYLFRNKNRGNARFDAVRDLFGLDLNNSIQDYSFIDSILNEMKERSVDFLNQNLK